MYNCFHFINVAPTNIKHNYIYFVIQTLQIVSS